jgi:phosphatidylglycerol:prolipoprotein diacylglycerol transferase
VIPYFEPPEIQIPVPGFGALPIHAFGVLVALGFVLGGNLAMARARRVGLDPDAINRLIGWLVGGTFVGGHLGYLLMYDFDNFVKNPMLILQFWHGLSSFGGFIVCVPISVWFFRREKLPVWPYLDCLAYGFSFGWFMGRMGCTSAHDHPGTPAPEGFPLGFWCRPEAGHVVNTPSFLVSHGNPTWGPCQTYDEKLAELSRSFGSLDAAKQKALELFPSGPVNLTHDMGFYEALWSLGMFGLFVLLDKKPRTPGFYPLVLGVFYGPTRFLMDFLRPDSSDNRWLDLITPGQFWSLVLTAVCAYFLAKRMGSGDAPVWRAAAGAPPPAEPGAGG